MKRTWRIGRLAHAIDQVAACGENDSMLEEAIKERRKAIVALQKALEQEPRRFQQSLGTARFMQGVQFLAGVR